MDSARSPFANRVSPNELITLLDFDRTLYDTGRFANDLWNDVAQQTDLPFTKVKSDAKQYKIHPLLGGYDFAKHVAAYNLNTAAMWQRLEKIAQSTNYLYVDSPVFVQALLTDGYRPHILTLGEPRIQTVKIEHCKSRLLGKYAASRHLDATVVQYSKSEYIADTYPGQRGILIDDVPDQNLPPGFTEICINRHVNLPQPKQIAPNIFTVSSLAQAHQIIMNL